MSSNTATRQSSPCRRTQAALLPSRPRGASTPDLAACPLLLQRHEAAKQQQATRRSVGDKGEACGRRASEPLLACRLQAPWSREIALCRRSDREPDDDGLSKVIVRGECELRSGQRLRAPTPAPRSSRLLAFRRSCTCLWLRVSAAGFEATVWRGKAVARYNALIQPGFRIQPTPSTRTTSRTRFTRVSEHRAGAEEAPGWTNLALHWSSVASILAEDRARSSSVCRSWHGSWVVELGQVDAVGLDDRRAVWREPVLARAIVVELDSIAIGVAQVDRDRRAVIAGVVDRVVVLA